MKRKRTFGQAISELRQGRGLNQRELAARVRKEDGSSISQQYLNDIENGRRNPPGDHIIEQLAKVLKADQAFLTYVAGQMPRELRDVVDDPDALRQAIEAFRRAASDQSGGIQR